MKVHKNQWLLTLPSSPNLPCEATNQGTHYVSGVQTPSQCPDTGLSPEKLAYNPLRIKHFHMVSTGNQPLYLLKSRYGKVSSYQRPSITVLIE